MCLLRLRVDDGKTGGGDSTVVGRTATSNILETYSFVNHACGHFKSWTVLLVLVEGITI